MAARDRYGVLLLAEACFAYLRQVLQVWGARRQAGAQEEALLDRILGADAGELERLGFARLLHLLTRDLAKLEPLEVYMMTE